MPFSCPVCASSAPSTACPIAADWADDQRMVFLTSHTAPDDTNARDQMVKFWSKAVAHAFEQARSLSLDPAQLARGSLAWGGATAPGVGLAMEHLLGSAKLVPRSEIEAETRFATRLVSAPLAYLMGLLGVGTGTEEIPSGQHVHRDVLESVAESVVVYCQRLPEEERTVYLHPDTDDPLKPSAQPMGDAASPSWCFEQLCRAAAGSSASESVASRVLSSATNGDLTLLAAYLVTTKRAVREEGLLKIVAGGGGGAGSRSGKAAISETDRDLLRLRHTVASLQAMASDLGRRIHQSQLDAVRENRQGQKRAALVHLRRMKQLQTARDNRLSSLFTLETALNQVKQLRMDKQVLEAHEAATSALKACREVQGLTVERVEDTLDELAQEMAEHQAIGTALSQNDAMLLDEDELAGLESELDELLLSDAAAGTTIAETASAACSDAPLANVASPERSSSGHQPTDSVCLKPGVAPLAAPVPGKTAVPV